MSRIEVFNCQSALATIPTPPQAFMCCGFCCDFPLFFVGTVGLVGPLFNTPENLAFCEANYSYAPTYMILWRVNPCPEVAYAGIPYGPELRVAQGLNGSIYPICEGTDLSGADFTTVWKIGNPISVTGSCSKTDGNIVFNMSGTFRKELCVMYFDITGWGGFADQDCAKEGTAPYWCVLDSDTNTYSCICSWYLPPGAISGPHITLSDCNTACSTSSQAPWWCVTGTCSQSALNPCAPPAACDVKGPFQTIGDCQEVCFLEQGPGWYCNNFYDPDRGIVTDCQYFMRTPLTGSLKYDNYADCSAACPSGEVPPPPVGDWWCLYGYPVQSTPSPDPAATGPFVSYAAAIDAGCGPAEMVWICGDDGICSLMARASAIVDGYPYSFTEEDCLATCSVLFWCTVDGCVGYRNWYTPTNIGGPFTTIEQCYAFCIMDEVPGWYCVSGQCLHYAGRPYGAVGPMYATGLTCGANCFEPMGIKPDKVWSEFLDTWVPVTEEE